MKNFFSVLKDSDPFLRMLLITGVSKFSKVSLFSDLNNLQDITLHPRYATLTGYTSIELDQYFGSEYAKLANANRIEVSEVKTAIQQWYNGYQWEVGSPVYNPFSVLNLFDSTRFANYWWESGTPTFLLKLLKQEFQYDLSAVSVGDAVFESFTLERMSWQSLLFQTGYLTIKEYRPELEIYTLSYPNREVKAAMFQNLLGEYRHKSPAETKPLYANIKLALDAGDLPRLMEQIEILFAGIPYQLFDAKRERFFHAVLHLTFQGLGLLTDSEVSAAHGRVDTVVHAESAI